MSQEGIDYALAGGMALVLHGYRRETVDVDVLLSKEERTLFTETLRGKYLELWDAVARAGQAEEPDDASIEDE